MISRPLWESYGNTPARWTLRLTTTLHANLKSFEHPLELQHRLELFGRFSRFWHSTDPFSSFRCVSMCFDVFRCASSCWRTVAWYSDVGPQKTSRSPENRYDNMDIYIYIYIFIHIWIIHIWITWTLVGDRFVMSMASMASVAQCLKLSRNPHWRLPSPANRPCGGRFPERSHVLHEAGQTRVQNVRLSKKWFK